MRVAAVRTLGEMLRARDPEVESLLWGLLLGEKTAAAAVLTRNPKPDTETRNPKPETVEARFWPWLSDKSPS